MADAEILIIEDEPDIAELIRFHLDREGYPAQVLGTGRVAMDVVRRMTPRLVILDLMLPDLDGLEVCRRLRYDQQTRHVPILIVSAKGDETEIVTGLELGADDYVTKPFSPKVLMARVRNILRRSSEVDSPDESSTATRLSRMEGELIIDVDRHRVLVQNQPIELTPTEFDILRCLAARPGFVRTRDQIIAAVHGQQTVLSSRTIDVHLTAIRRKLGPLGPRIETVRGVGYRLSEQPPETVEQ